MSGFLGKLMGTFLRRERRRCSAVIVAAGASVRMGGENKIFREINGIPVLARTLAAFQSAPLIDEIIVVVRESDADAASELCGAYSKASKIVFGGETRTQSVYNGIMQCAGKSALIAIHDGARPLISQEIIEDAVRLAAKHGAAAPGVPVTSTLKRVKNGVVISTPDRSEMYEIQTPQVFDADLIKGAVSAALDHALDYTDDCAAAEAAGATVWISQGAYGNIKITTQTDLSAAEAILRADRSGARS